MANQTMMIVRDPDKPVYRLLLAQRLKEGLRRLGNRAKFCDADPARVAARFAAERPDVLLSVSLYPELGRLAAAHGVPYFCWDYDKIMNPQLFDRALYAPTTYFFATYLGDVRRLQALGVKACYLPALPPLPPASTLEPSEAERAAYAADISFVGSSVISVSNSYLKLKALLTGGEEGASDPARAALWQLVTDAVRAQEAESRHSRYRLPELLAEAMASSPYAGALDPEVLHTFLGKECCRFQRLHFLEALRDFSVTVYGAPDWTEAGLPHVHYGGHLSYEDAAPKVFQCSKINLNIARIYSMDGMSDRVGNVLSVGGFLLTNPIEGLERSFTPGKELVVFSTAAELREACAYYLAHPAERAAVAAAGRARIARDHVPEQRLGAMFAFLARHPPGA